MQGLGVSARFLLKCCCFHRAAAAAAMCVRVRWASLLMLTRDTSRFIHQQFLYQLAASLHARSMPLMLTSSAPVHLHI
jgi:hypothetical protein